MLVAGPHAGVAGTVLNPSFVAAISESALGVAGVTDQPGEADFGVRRRFRPANHRELYCVIEDTYSGARRSYRQVQDEGGYA